MQILGIALSKKSYNEIFEEITSFTTQQIVFTPNPEILLQAKTDREFRELLKRATFLTADGIGLYIAFQIQDSPINNLLRNKGRFGNVLGIIGNILLLPYFFFNLFFRKDFLYKKYGERICGSDLTGDLVPYAEKNNIKVTIIDPYFPQDFAKCASQKTFRQDLQKVFPNLQFDYFIYKPEEKESIIEQIKNSDSQVLFSTLGMKKQEQSVVEIMDKCYNIKLGLGIGSSFDYFIGFQKRAPKIWRALGLEWMYRLFTGPKKILRLKRLWRAIVVFIWEVLRSK